MFSDWAKGDPIRAAREVQRVPESLRSVSPEGEWRPAAQAWAAEDPEGFYDWLVEGGIPPGSEVLKVLYQECVKQDVFHGCQWSQSAYG